MSTDLTKPFELFFTSTGRFEKTLLNMLGCAMSHRSLWQHYLDNYPATDLPMLIFEDDVDLEVRIIDSGSGLKADKIDNLFDPFGSAKELKSGMSLVICKNIIGAHGGIIWYAKLKNGQSCFHFTLPIHFD